MLKVCFVFKLPLNRATRLLSKIIEIFIFPRHSITTLDNVTKKLEVVEAFLYQLETTYHQLCEKLTLKFAYSCIGLMLYEFIKGWNYRALSQVFRYL